MSSIKPATSTSEPKSIPDSATVTPATCQACKPAPIFSMNTLKTTLWYMAVGVASGALLNYLGVIAYASDNGHPRSICLSRNKNMLCSSWASYAGNGLPDEAYDTITRYSTDCAQSGGSAEFKAIINDGGILFICQRQS
ncbi:hypothetical protein KCU78_g502, partial [Aureobasidium melanogenum]